MRQIVPFIFMAVIIGILVGANIYLSRRFGLFFSMEKTRLLNLLFGVLSIFMIAGIIVFSNATSRFANLSYSAAAITMGFMLYLLLSVFAVDLAGLIFRIPEKTMGLAAIFLAVFISGYGIINASTKQIRTVDVHLKGLTTQLKAVQLTDIHIGHFWGVKTLKNIVEKTNAQNPDVVFITGDLFDGRVRLQNATLEPLKELKAPVYFVEGNHDGYTGAREIKTKLKQMGVTVLENQVTHFSELQIVGLNHMRADSVAYNMHANSTTTTIKSTLDSLHLFPEKPTILLHHSPDGIKYANQHGIDLYLAGHTHAGQIFPINFIAKLMFDYNKGLHNFNGTQIYVSQGAGTFGPPMRVGTISELTVLNLKPL